MARRTRLDRVQRGIHQVMSQLVTDGVVEDAGWVNGQQPFQTSTDEPPKTLLTYALSAGPSEGVREGAHHDITIKPPDSVVVRFNTAVLGARPFFRLNGFEHWHDVTAAGDLTAVRDAFIASVNLEHERELVATANDPNEMLLTANFLGGLWALDKISGDITVGDDVYSDDAVTITTGNKDSTLTLNAYSKARTLKDGARDILDDVVAELADHAVVQTLRRYGMSLGARGPMIPLDAIAGANWETRAAIDVAIRTTSYVIKPVDLVETVNMTLSIFTPGASTPFTQTISASVP